MIGWNSLKKNIFLILLLFATIIEKKILIIKNNKLKKKFDIKLYVKIFSYILFQ